MTLKELKYSREEARRFAMTQPLKELRGPLSQKEVSEAARVPVVYISRVENKGPNGIGAEALRRIVEVYRSLTDGSE